MNEFELIKYIERVRSGLYDQNNSYVPPLGEIRDLSYLCSDGKYIYSKNGVIPLFSHRNFYAGDFLGYGRDGGIRGFIPAPKELPELSITSLADELYDNHMKEKNKPTSFQQNVSTIFGSPRVAGRDLIEKLPKEGWFSSLFKKIWKKIF